MQIAAIILMIFKRIIESLVTNNVSEQNTPSVITSIASMVPIAMLAFFGSQLSFGNPKDKGFLMCAIP